jgi:hypothetical protein
MWLNGEVDRGALRIRGTSVVRAGKRFGRGGRWLNAATYRPDELTVSTVAGGELVLFDFVSAL